MPKTAPNSDPDSNLEAALVFVVAVVEGVALALALAALALAMLQKS
jgi:hypothetical protein